MKSNLELHHALWRTDFYGLLTFVFSRPSPMTFSNIRELSWNLMERADDQLKLQLHGFTASTLDVATITTAYDRLFDESNGCSLCEGRYHFDERRTVMADITTFYRAFSFSTQGEKQPVDALVVELEYMQFMAQKIVHALEKNKKNSAEVTSCAMRQFLLDHLGRWVPMFSTHLMESTSEFFYLSAAKLLTTWIERECREYDILPQALSPSSHLGIAIQPSCC
ncbi:MAG: molecular chaperone TorD family protein [Deltaproteobacteria bacterium]|nr:molecular chaperone TorD family protein [Deltaproteobacteria bacterium]